MVSVYQLKSSFQDLLRPCVARLAKSGVTANAVTLAALALSAFGGICMAVFSAQRWPWLILPLILFIRMALNAVDGMLAREHGMKTRLGAILNELCDVLSDTALYLPFALLPGSPAVLVTLICIFSPISEMAGIIGLQVNASRRYDGPMGKSDRALVFGTAGLILGLGIAPGAWLTVILFAVLALLCVTIVNRAAKALKEGEGNA